MVGRCRPGLPSALRLVSVRSIIVVATWYGRAGAAGATVAVVGASVVGGAVVVVSGTVVVVGTVVMSPTAPPSGLRSPSSEWCVTPPQPARITIAAAHRRGARTRRGSQTTAGDASTLRTRKFVGFLRMAFWMDVLKVSSKSNPNAVAGALANVIRSARAVELQVVGAGALNQAVKAVAIARNYLADTAIDLVCIPAFADVEIDG